MSNKITRLVVNRDKPGDLGLLQWTEKDTGLPGVFDNVLLVVAL